MATIRKRQDKWQVQVRRTGSQSFSKSFTRKSDAQIWARRMEANADTCNFGPDPASLYKITFGDLMQRYLEEVTPRKKGGAIEAIVVRALQRHKIASLCLAELTPERLSKYRDERLETVQGSTVVRQFVIFQHILKIAKVEWNIPLPNNPAAMIQKPPQNRPRKRRLNPGDYESLLNASRQSKAWHIWPLIELAIETGMRRGELLKATWDDLDIQGRKLTLRDTKNGDDRTIPLTRKAVDILGSLPRTSERIFPVTPVAVRQAWERLRNRAGLRDLNFHDLRHEAISRFFEMGLSVPEVALISGHKDYRMLARYTHLRADDVVGKLR